MWPADPTDFKKLEKALQKLSLEDPSVAIRKDESDALGSGFQCGFLGWLHMDVFRSRVQSEFDVDSFFTTPSVIYQVVDSQGREILVSNVNQLADLGIHDLTQIAAIREPMTEATILTPRK